MHRVRQSLAYYGDFGWEVQVLCVNPQFTEAYKDDSLLQTIPSNLLIHRVSAPSAQLTRKFGLGSIALRSLIPMYLKGNEIIRYWNPDLVFISTTQFPSMLLGAWWKSKFKIPYVLDFQDPWHHNHYVHLPANQRPAKFWFSYRLNKYLEPRAVRKADGIIAVTQAYIDTLKNRYPEIKECPEAVIPFGASPEDVREEYACHLPEYFPPVESSIFRMVYTGVVNQEMIPVIRQFLLAFRELISNREIITPKFHLYFIGTSYGSGVNRKHKLAELVKELSLEEYLTEIPERVAFLTALQIQKHADLLLLPGTTDKNYLASKLAPYLLSGRPIFSIFRRSSEAYKKLVDQKRVVCIPFDSEVELEGLNTSIFNGLLHAIKSIEELAKEPIQHPEKYSAEILTGEQVKIFNKIYGVLQPKT
jgi:glycosyltransferase involved in cell wall biosynthesis